MGFTSKAPEKWGGKAFFYALRHAGTERANRKKKEAKLKYKVNTQPNSLYVTLV